MHPSMWTSSMWPASAEESVETLAKVGYRFLELSDEHWRELNARNNPEFHFRKLRKLFDRLKLTVPQMHGPMFDVCDVKHRRKNRTLASQALRWAGLLGVRWVVFHPGFVPMVDDAEAEEMARNENLKQFLLLVEEAAKWKTGIAIENSCDGYVRGRRIYGATASELVWLVEKLKADNVGINWDTGHAHIQGLDQARALCTIGSHLVGTHLADNHGTSDEHLFPFGGTVDWASVMKGLRQIGYSGFLNLEVHGYTNGVPLSLRPAILRYSLEVVRYLIRDS